MYRILLLIFCLATSFFCHAAKLAIVIDDVGYRPQNERKLIYATKFITTAILPNAPYAFMMAQEANQHGNEILIHLPMAPISKQPLEKNTLQPTMTQEMIEQIIESAIKRVPYAKGMNNHMGSAMTADYLAMESVLSVLSRHKLYFLDSKTIGRSQVSRAGKKTGVPVLVRNIFLDDTLAEKSIQKQLNYAITFARKKGAAIVIGHPHKQTVNVLLRNLPNLPPDIELVALSGLLPMPVKQPPLIITETKNEGLPEKLLPDKPEIKTIIIQATDSTNRWLSHIFSKQTEITE